MGPLSNVLLDLLPQRVALLDITGNITTVNKAWYDFAKAATLPGKLDHLVNGNYLEACAKKDCKEAVVFLRGIKSVINQEVENFEMEYECSPPDGEEAWFTVCVKPVNNYPGASLIVIHTDITKQKIAEKRANTERNFLYQILELAGDAIIVANKKQEICIFNRSAKRIFGYSEEEIIGKPLSFLLPCRLHNTFHNHAKEFIDKIEPSHYVGEKHSVIGLHKDGKEFPVDIAISKLLSQNELFFTAIIRDMSELKVTNKLLKEHTTVLASMSESMAVFLQAHDLKKAIQPMLQTISTVSKSEFVGLGFFIDTSNIEIITSKEEIIQVKITKAVYEELESDYIAFKDISLDEQFAYLIIKSLSSSFIHIENAMSTYPSNLILKGINTLRNFISLPIRCQEKITSVLILASGSTAHDEENIMLIEPAIETLGVIYDSFQHIQQKVKLENQQKITQQELLTRAHQQSLLVRLGRQALLEPDISKLMEYFVNSIKDILAVDCCFVLEFDENNTLFLRPESYGLFENSQSLNIKSSSFSTVNSNSLVNILLSSTGPLIIDELETDLRFTTPRFFKSQKFTSGISVVLYIDNEVFGFLGAFTRVKRFFTSNEANFLQTIAHTLVTAIKHKQDEDKLGEHLKLIDASHEAIIACDLKQKVVFWSKGASNLYGVSKQKAIGASIDSLITNQDNNLIDSIIEIVYSANEWVGEITSKDANDNERIVLSHWSLVYDNFRKPKTFLLVNTNITEKKKLETQFLRTQRMENLGSLASGIAHDLNNLLTPIMLSLDLLKKRADERSLKLIEKVESSTRRGSEMVKQIVSFAKGIETTQATISIQNILDELLSMLKISFPPNIRIYTNCSPKIWLVQANATQIFQVLMNLCVNAREAMSEGGLLSIMANNIILDNFKGFKEFKEPAPFVEISVSDSGTGISTEQIKKIFEPFFTTKGANGTGLGLSMVASIIEKHNGFIRVDSELSKGTNFSIYLPAIKDNKVKESFINKDLMNVGNNQTILLVDSEVSTLEISKATLEAYNYKVFSTNSGIEAIKFFSAERLDIDAVVVDMVVAEIESDALISLLKKSRPQVKIIVTGNNESNTYHKLNSLPFSIKKVVKPYTAETLLKSLKEILS